MVALLDMDAFFAMIESVRNPFLKGKPVAVIGWGKRTAVSSVNYKAKKLGVTVGMSPHMAKKTCPDVILVKADFAEYESISYGIERLVNREFPRYIRYSIDEFYIDLNLSRPMEKLHRLKRDIYEMYKLTCSVGVAPNPILSKIACERSKPNGFLVVKKDHIERFIEHLPVSIVPGVGEKTQKYLKKMNISTVKELIEFSKKGFSSRSLNDIVDSLTVINFNRKEFFKRRPPKSFGHMKTLDVNISNPLHLKEISFYLLYRSFLRMIRGGYKAKTVSLIIRYAKYDTISCSKTLRNWSSDFITLSKVIEILFDRVFSGEDVRMIGVSLSNLKSLTSIQLGLFNSDKFLEAISIKNVEISSRLFLKEYGKKKAGLSRPFKHPPTRQGIDFCTVPRKNRSF